MRVDRMVQRAGALGLMLALAVGLIPSVGVMAAGDEARTIEISNNYTACAVRTDDTVWCWGNNDTSGVGDGTDADQRNTPVQVQRATGPLVNVSQIAQGEYHACALRRSGTVACWGEDTAAGGTQDSNVAVNVPGLTNVVEVAAGFGFTCARKGDGSVWCWGDDGSESLGNGNAGSGPTPTKVKRPGGFLKNAIAIAAGSQTACALLADRTLRCWGGNGDGLLTDGTTDNSGLALTIMRGSQPLRGVEAVDLGRDHICVALQSGNARCWGGNANAQLGDGTQTDRPFPTLVKRGTGLLTGVTDISAGPSLTCAVAGADQFAFCWGYNSSGQVGDGTSVDPRKTATKVIRAPAQPIAVRSVAAGEDIACAVRLDRAAFCWGYGAEGAIGNGGTDSKNVATRVLFPELTPAPCCGHGHRWGSAAGSIWS